MLGTVFKEIGGYLDRRFFLNVWVPVQLFWLALLALGVMGHGFSEAMASWEHTSTTLQLALVIVSFAAGTIIAFVFAGALGWLMAFYEGYHWEQIPLLNRIEEPKKKYYREILAKLADDRAKTETKIERDEATIYFQYPLPDMDSYVMPTRLGNVLRSAELYPLVRYQLNGVLAWPRLYAALPDSLTKTIASVRSDMDLMLVLSVLGGAFSVLGGFVAALCLPFYAALACCWGGALLCYLGYRGLLQSAQSYAQLFKAVFDVHRGTLLKSLGMEAPTSLTEERERWKQLVSLWFKGFPESDEGANALGYPAAKVQKPSDKAAEGAQAVVVTMTVTPVAEERGH